LFPYSVECLQPPKETFLDGPNVIVVTEPLPPLDDELLDDELLLLLVVVTLLLLLLVCSVL